MHVRDRRAFHLLEPVRDCIDQCTAFATEFNLGEISAPFDPAMLALPAGQSLEDLIPPRKYGRLRKIILKSYGIDLHYFRDKKPIIIANLIDERILARNMPFSLDQELWMYARSAGKKLMGIETYEEQLEILQKVPLQKQLEALLATGRNVSRHRRHLRKMAELYEKGEIRRLYQSARRGAQSLRKLMLYDRNEVMAGRIAAIVQDQTAVCAVGAGHLPGEKGLLRLLKHRGMRIGPVR